MFKKIIISLFLLVFIFYNSVYAVISVGTNTYPDLPSGYTDNEFYIFNLNGSSSQLTSGRTYLFILVSTCSRLIVSDRYQYITGYQVENPSTTSRFDVYYLNNNSWVLEKSSFGGGAYYPNCNLLASTLNIYNESGSQTLFNANISYSGSNSENSGFFNSVLDGLSGITSIFSNILSYLNPLSSNFILTQVVTFLGNLVGFINPESNNFFGNQISSLFSSLLQTLFIPSEVTVNGFVNSVKSKFDFIDTIKISINSLKDSINTINGNPSITVNVGATNYTPAQNIEVINLSWYTPFKPYGDLIFTAFCYLLFLWRLFIHLPNIVNGTGGDVYHLATTDIYKTLKGGRL